MDITSAISGSFGIIFLLVWILLIVFALISILRHANINRDNKFLWVVIVLLVPIVGQVTYWIWHGSKKP